jgi:acyl carrier protein
MSAGKTCQEIESWMVSYLAKELKVRPEQIPLDQTLTDLGLTSRQAVFLSGELEEYTGQPVDPAIAWEYPTIRRLADHLARAASAFE